MTDNKLRRYLFIRREAGNYRDIASLAFMPGMDELTDEEQARWDEIKAEMAAIKDEYYAAGKIYEFQYATRKITKISKLQEAVYQKTQSFEMVDVVIGLEQAIEANSEEALNIWKIPGEHQNWWRGHYDGKAQALAAVRDMFREAVK